MKLRYTILTAAIIAIASVAVAGCAIPGLVYGHTITGYYSTWSNFNTAGDLLIYEWPATSGRLDTYNGTGCTTYAQNIKQWGSDAYVYQDFGNNASCTTLTQCPSTTNSIVFVAYNQVSEGTSSHDIRIIIDSANREPPWTFDDSNAQTACGGVCSNAALGSLGISSANCTGSPATCDVVVTIPEPAVYGDGTIPLNQIIAGYQVLYLDAASAPTTGDSASWNAINDPELDDYIPYDGTGTATSNTITISGLSNTLYLAWRPVFAYDGACTTMGSCTSTEIQTLANNGFAIGYVSANSAPINPTPVTFASFTGSYQDLQHVALNWETASETDAAGFILYRSLDGINWTQVNQTLIPAQGQGGAGAVYTYTDTLPKQRTYQKWFYKVVEITNANQRAAETQTVVSR